MSDDSSLGQRLRARRTALDLTLSDVAERSGLSLQYISNLERGRGNPTLDAVQSLARALTTSVTALIGDEAASEPLVGVLADAPRSLQPFSRSKEFADVVNQLAIAQGATPEAMRRRLLVAMASAPRRSSGEPTEHDWRRLLDVYSLILRDR
jgi:transcriptional regulator with XRE-family HTH domain